MSYQKYKLINLSFRKQLGGSPEDDYDQFVQSPECQHFFSLLNMVDLKNTSPKFIQEIKATLQNEHNYNPSLHADELTYSIDTFVTGMIPGSEWSTIPEDLQPIGKKYLAVLLALNPDTPIGSIGHVIKTILNL